MNDRKNPTLPPASNPELFSGFADFESDSSLKRRSEKLTPKNNRKKGFTLLELLLTLSLFSVIMTFVVNSFLQFKQQGQRAESILKIRQEIRNIERLLRDDLQSVIYLNEYTGGSGPFGYEKAKSGIYGENDFLGDKDADRLHMHVNRPSRFYYSLPIAKDPEIHEVSYYLAERDGKTRLKCREEFYIDSEITEGDRSITHTLSENVIAFDVKYYQKSSGYSEHQEMEEWDSIKAGSKRKIPVGVKVTLELKEENGETVKSEMQVNLHPDMGKSLEWSYEN